jgi:hypothetical protein
MEDDCNDFDVVDGCCFDDLFVLDLAGRWRPEFINQEDPDPAINWR